MKNLRAIEYRSNPFPFYEEIRAAGPVVYDQDLSVWYFGRYREVAEILRDEDSFSCNRAGVEPSITGSDGTLHKRNRSFLQPAFGATQLASLERNVQGLADRLVSEMARKRECEIVGDFASAIPATVTAWMLGLEESRIDDIRRWNRAFMHPGYGGCPVSKLRRRIGRLIGKKDELYQQERAECRAFLKKHFQSAAWKDGDRQGWVTDLILQERNGDRLAEEEMVDLAVLVLVGATETTTNFISNTVLRLVRDPELQEKLRADSGLWKPFLEEMLRFDSPVQLRLRFTTAPVKIADVTIPEKAHVEILLASANRDPEIFPDADTFCPDRESNRHLAFGLGTHFCMGAQFTRMETLVALSALLRQLPLLTLADPSAPIDYLHNYKLRGLRSLTVKW